MKEKDGFLKEGFLTDKGPFAIGIKEDSVMNHTDVRERSWKGARVGRYARLKTLPGGVWSCGQSGTKTKQETIQTCLLPVWWENCIEINMWLPLALM